MTAAVTQTVGGKPLVEAPLGDWQAAGFMRHWPKDKPDTPFALACTSRDEAIRLAHHINLQAANRVRAAKEA